MKPVLLFLITSFGARPGGAFLNTTAINKAIDACWRHGGGTVEVPAGVYRTGTIFMKDNVELHLDMGAVLVASTKLSDMPVQPPAAYRSQKDAPGWRTLIYADSASNIAISGFGTIDGNGAQQKPDPATSLKGDLDGRPRNILFISCKHVRVEGIRMLNAGIWNQHYLNCEDVVVDKVNVYNHANRNNDGIDIDGCRRFTLSNSIFDTDDDGIVLKSTGPAGCEDVVITNCIVSSHCNAIKAGTESTGGFRNIAISNCVVKPSVDTHPTYGVPGGVTALSLEIVDGGVMDGVSISNIAIEGTECPLYVRLGNRARKYNAAAPEPPVGIMRNIVIDNVVAHHTGNFCSSITGIPGHAIENLSLSNIQFFNIGGATAAVAIDAVPEDEKGYPQPTGELPSSGLFIRHAANVQVHGMLLGSDQDDARPPVVAVDVDGLAVEGVGEMRHCTSPVFIRAVGVKDLKADTPLGWEGRLTGDR